MSSVLDEESKDLTVLAILKSKIYIQKSFSFFALKNRERDNHVGAMLYQLLLTDIFGVFLTLSVLVLSIVIHCQKYAKISLFGN